MLEVLKRLFERVRARERPDVIVVRVTEGVASDRSLIMDQPAALLPLPDEQIRPAGKSLSAAAPPERSHAEMVDSPQTPGAYMIGLVGEQHYTTAVAALRPGAPVFFELEPDNPDESSAIAAVDARGRVLGYIAQESWLREAVYAGGASFSARALAVEMGGRGFREVVLEVEANEEPLRERHYQPRQVQLL